MNLVKAANWTRTRCDHYSPFVLRADIEKILPIVPSEPGVYLFYSSSHQLLYVGKAKNIRKRLLQHFNGNADPGSGRIRVMHASVRHASWITTCTELLALLLEDSLIKRLKPIYNKQQAKMAQQVWLRVEGAPVPTIKMVTDPSDAKTDAVYGPYKDRHFAGFLVEIARSYYGARGAAGYAARTRRKARLALGGELGETSPIGTPERCRDLVSAFFGGDEPELLNHLRAEMTRHTDSQQFEQAARKRDTIAFCERFFARQQFELAFRTGKLTIGHGPWTYTFSRGDLVESRDGQITRDVWKSTMSFEAADVRWLVDRAAIVTTWLNQNPEATVSFE